MNAQDLLTTVQYALLEPPTGGLSWASGLWDTDEVLGYLTSRQQSLLKSTHLLVGVADIDTSAEVGTYPLPDDWIASVHLAWEARLPVEEDARFVPTPPGAPQLPDPPLVEIPVLGRPSGVVRELLPADHVQADYGMAGWQATSGTPIAYTDVNVGTRTVQLIPAPETDGILHVIYVPLATTLIGDAEPLQFPATHGTPILKYAVLADCLSKLGDGQDPLRAQYCAWRVRLGEDVTRLLLNGMG